MTAALLAEHLKLHKGLHAAIDRSATVLRLAFDGRIHAADSLCLVHGSWSLDLRTYCIECMLEENKDIWQQLL